MIYVALYGATSVQRVMDFIKTVYAFPNSIPVVIKPIGAAAQIGIPEAYRYAYRSGKSLIVLPEVADLLTILNVSRIYYISSSGNEIEPRELGTDN
ncbi:MAG: RecB-family nuclease, partial [Thermoprotei archaeon]